MFGISFAELVIIFLLVLIVMGPEKLPEVARWAGKGMRQLRQASNTVRDALAAGEVDPSHPGSPAITEQPTTESSSPTSKSSTPYGSSSGGDGRASSGPADREPSPPSNLDQVDDDQFDELLRQQYEEHDDSLDDVALPPAGDAGDLVDVDVDNADPDPEALYDVALRPPTTAEGDR